MMKRRSFFATVPALSALLAMRASGKPVAKEALSPAGFTIAVQCWSFNRYTVWQAIEKTAESGANAVELFPGHKLGGPHGDKTMGPRLDAAIYQSLLDHASKHGVAIVNFGVCDIPSDEAKARPVFELARTLGLYGLTTESAGSIATIDKLAEEYEVKVCFHNHPKGSALWDPNKVWDLVKDRHPNVGFCADIGHWATSGLDPLEVIKKVGSRVHAFHFKDREAIGKETHDRPFGTGVIQLAAILDEVREHGFAGNVSIEYEHNWEKSVPDIAQCVGFLRGYSQAVKA
jgi:sugar phosphate isomerase/epimerase